MEGIPNHILVADGQLLCRAGLAAMFSRDLGIATVDEAGSFDDMVAAIARNPGIALVTIDLDLPGMRGPEKIRQMRLDHPSLRVVIVAATRDRQSVLDALCAGVHGYVPKDLPASEMLDAFRSVLAGHIYVPALVSDVCAKPQASAQRNVAPHDQSLTDRQFEVLGLLAAGRSNKEIARALRIAEGTVKVHITAAFRALGVHNRVSAAAALHNLPEPEAMRGAFIPGLFAPERRGRGAGPAGGPEPLPLAS
ncbi:LuxR C-terminal-related transcriptional regulator [Sphingomonas gilva]|uniref:LuxR C-terminal-related transcriptional regulator n=1 Tax=Sphingomonas gilva TaxID=2305907 RepID=UPI0015FD92DB|nr:response regulator transcription factor [Sphingomonas gilva]